jgi:NAD+ kinase
MFKKILLIYSSKENSQHLDSLTLVEDILNEERLNFQKILIEHFDVSFLKGVDLVISLGGDGTFIRISHYLKDIPILGINSDYSTSEGGLCSLSERDVGKLKDILKGKYKSRFRNRIDIVLNGYFVKERALNEVYVGTKDQFHTSRYVINFKNLKEEHRSSGVIVSTGSGSNVWYKSAGGEPFNFEENKLKFLIREPFFSRLFQPNLLEGEILKGEEIYFDSKRCMGGIIAVDSNVIYDFNEGDRVRLEISKFPLKVLEKI